MSTVDVNKDILLWALDRSGQSLEDVLPAFPKLRDWIAGKCQPTLRQLEELAQSTHTPLGFFFLDQPPEERLPVPHFRTTAGERPGRPSPALLDTVYCMQIRQAWMRDEEKEQGQEPLSFVGSARVGERQALIAQRMRTTLGFEENWAERERTWADAHRRLREAMERARIMVVANGIVGNNTRRKLDPAEFRGFVLVDQYAPLVFVNNADGKAAQMFTLAHELAHVFFGSSAAFDLRQLMPANDKTEQACDQVAAEFLVPESQLRKVWPVVQGEQRPFQAIARRFKVSEIVAARRALDLHLVDRGAFLEFYRVYINTERHNAQEAPGGGDFYANQMTRVGTRFGVAVARAVREGRLGYTEAYRMTGLYGRTFEQFTASLINRGT